MTKRQYGGILAELYAEDAIDYAKPISSEISVKEMAAHLINFQAELVANQIKSGNVVQAQHLMSMSAWEFLGRIRNGEIE